jgi:dolichol-phosphate mannosyltransferase
VKENIKISIVSPVYRAANIVEELVKQIEQEVSAITSDYEIILVEDASPDESWEVIERIAAINSSVKGYKFSRNFGQHAAIKAGLSSASGDVVVVMDCDLQDNPKYIIDLVNEYKKGFDIVYTHKIKRNHSKFKNISALAFNKVFNYLTESSEAKSDNNIGSYSLLSKKVVVEFLKYNDYQFHYLMVLRWLGFKTSSVIIEHKERYEGKSSYTLKKLIDHAIVGIVYQSDKLLRLNIYIGGIIALVSLLFGVFIVLKSFFVPFQSGWTSLVVLISFSLGVMLTSLGIVGLYIGKMFEQTKSRPQFIISEKTS